MVAIVKAIPSNHNQ